MNDDDLALGYALGTLEETDRVRAADLIASDQTFAAAVARNEKDLLDLKRGLELVAGNIGGPRQARRPRWIVPIAAAAAGLAVAGSIVVASRGEERPIARPTQPSISNPAPGPTLSLQEKVSGAGVIVVGTVTDVATGSFSPGDGGTADYAMVTVRVEEEIKGEAADAVVAFDYVYGFTSGEGGPGGVWAEVGDRLLLFLVSDAGSVSENLQPKHLQVFQGFGGRFRIESGELVDAPFTLQDVRAEAAR